VESGQCGLVSIPETSARAAYVPIGEIVDVVGEYPAAALGIEIVQGIVHIPGNPCCFREHPLVDEGALLDHRCSRRWRPFRGSCIQRLEGNGVPVGQECSADNIGNRRVTDATGLPRRAGGQHEPAHCVSAVRVHQGDGFEHVPEVLTHLAAVFVQDVAEANNVLV